MFSEFMVDDGDELRVCRVCRSKKTASQQGNSHGLQIIPLHRYWCREVHVCALRRDVAVDDERSVAVTASSRQERSNASISHARKLLQAANQFAVELIHGRLGCVLLPGQGVAGRQDMVGTIAEIHGAHLLETAQQ